MLNCSGNVGDWKQVVAATTHTALRDCLQRARLAQASQALYGLRLHFAWESKEWPWDIKILYMANKTYIK